MTPHSTPLLRSPPSADLPPGVTAVPCAEFPVRWSRERLRSMVEEHTALMHRLMHEELPPQRYATPFDTPEFMEALLKL